MFLFFFLAVSTPHPYRWLEPSFSTRVLGSCASLLCFSLFPFLFTPPSLSSIYVLCVCLYSCVFPLSHRVGLSSTFRLLMENHFPRLTNASHLHIPRGLYRPLSRPSAAGKSAWNPNAIYRVVNEDLLKRVFLGRLLEAICLKRKIFPPKM